MDFDQTCTSILLRDGKELIRFCGPRPIFKVTLRLRLLENGLSAPCLLKKCVDFDKTCTAILLAHAKELIIFW